MAYETYKTTGARTSGQHSFAQIPKVEMQRSALDRSCGLTTAFQAGYLIPIFVDEALPGDTFTLSVETFARLATPIVPIMDNLWLDIFFFSSANRILWDNWKYFMGERVDPGDDPTLLTMPQMPVPTGGWATDSLGDYFGIPIKVDPLDVSALPFRMYNQVYNEWFRPEWLVDSLVVDMGDGPDDPADYVLVKRAKRHDYFTSALPFTQAGDPIQLPLGTSAPVSGTIAASGIPTFDVGAASNIPLQSTGGTGVIWGGTPGAGTNSGSWNTPNLALSGATADLSAATAATINSIREAFQIQRLLERDARGGVRYTELIKSHFQVESEDGRQQRPEYLGGGSAPIVMHPIAQTNIGYAADPTPKGDLSAFATSRFSGRGFTKSFTEHSTILGLACVRADLNYQEGLERMWSRQTRYDFYWPSLANLGEQAILNKEIFADGSANDDGTFGYQERYGEYRYKPSKITGRMRSQAEAFSPGDVTIHYWHLAQEFGSLPTLNQAFIEETPPMDRVLAVANEPEILMDCFFQYKCVRPMPVFGVPGLIDHF